MVCGVTEGEQDELKTIISAWLEVLHDSFPQADPSAAFTIHDRKANVNQILVGFFLYCSTPTLLLAREWEKKKTN